MCIATPGASDTDGTAFHWRAWGRGKRSVVLDLQTADGIDALHRLLASADILLETATSAERTAWGINVDDVADAYPRLVHVSITPFGVTGPLADAPATDMTLSAAGGS